MLVLLSLGRLSLEPQKKGGENLTPPLSSSVPQFLQKTTKRKLSTELMVRLFYDFYISIRLQIEVLIRDSEKNRGYKNKSSTQNFTKLIINESEPGGLLGS